MPEAALYRWRTAGKPRAFPFAQDVKVPICPGIAGENSWSDQDYDGSNVSAAQQTFLFPGEAKAHRVYAGLVRAMDGCQAESRTLQTEHGGTGDAVVTETAGGADDSAWARSWTAVNTPISSGGPQTDIEYIAQEGDAVSFVDFTLPGLTAPVPDRAAATSVLRAMIQDLSAYPGG
jgi:PknH-like extracellular domain